MTRPNQNMRRARAERVIVVGMRRVVAVLVAVATLLAASGIGAQRYFCSEMQEQRAEPCCPRAHEASSAPQLEDGDCACCRTARPQPASPAVRATSVDVPTASPLALYEPPSSAVLVPRAGQRLTIAPPTGPPPLRQERSLRMVFLL